MASKQLIKEQDKTEEVYITDTYRKKLEEAKKFEMIDKIKEEYNKKNTTNKDVGI